MSNITERVQSVRVGAIDYKLLQEKGLVKHSHVYGEIRYVKSKIALDAKLGEQHARCTLFHEIIHGILEQGGYTRHDERMVNIIATGVVQVLRDNPKLLKEMS